MRSDEIIIHFPPVRFEEGLEYLKGISGSMSSVIRDFSNLKDEQQMIDFKYPSWVSGTIQEYRDGRYSMDSDSFRNLNSAVTAINLLKTCARYNLAIYALQNRYRAEEATQYQSRWITQRSYSYGSPNWHTSTDEDVLRIKNAAIAVRDKIHAYSKKYTLPEFEQNFINTFKYTVYTTCDRFFVNTKTITEKATETGSNILGSIVAFVLFCLVFWLVAKCATGQ